MVIWCYLYQWLETDGVLHMIIMVIKIQMCGMKNGLAMIIHCILSAGCTMTDSDMYTSKYIQYILESTVSVFMISDSYDMPFAGWASEKSTGSGTCMNSSTSKAEGPCGIASLRRLKQPVFCGSQASLRRMLAAGSTPLNTFPNRLNISHMIIWISYFSTFSLGPWRFSISSMASICGLEGFQESFAS